MKYFYKVPLLRGAFLLEGEILMLYIKDKLPITEQDLQYFIGKWFQYATDETMSKKNQYRFRLVNDIIFVEFVTTHTYDGGMSTEYNQQNFVKMKQSFKEYPTYHLFYPNRQIVLDSELFFMENCKNLQKKLEGVK